jgi:hypothetical protein
MPLMRNNVHLPHIWGLEHMLFQQALRNLKACDGKKAKFNP